MLVAINILKDGVVFKDLKSDYYNQFNRKHKIKACLRKLEKHGCGDNICHVKPVASEMFSLVELPEGSLNTATIRLEFYSNQNVTMTDTDIWTMNFLKLAHICCGSMSGIQNPTDEKIESTDPL